MAQPFTYHVVPDRDGWGWIVMAEGYVAHSLPYGTQEEAIEVAEELVRQRPGSTFVVDEQAAALTPAATERRTCAAS